MAASCNLYAAPEEADGSFLSRWEKHTDNRLQKNTRQHQAISVWKAALHVFG